MSLLMKILKLDRGVGKPMRMIVGKLKPNQAILISEGTWTIKTLSTFRNAELSFKLDEPFKEKTPDGRDVESLCTVEGNSLIKTEKGQIETKTTREFSQDGFKMTMICGDVICTRHYKRAN